MNNLRKSQKIFALVLILIIMVQIIAPPQNVHAQSQEVIANILVSAGFCLASPWINRAIDRGIEEAKGWITSQGGKLLDRLGLGGAVDAVVGFFSDDEDEETGSGGVPTDTILDIPRLEKEERDCISNQVKEQLVTAVVNDIIDFARGGGDPRYIQNFGDKLLDAADGAAGEFVSNLAGENICSYFSPHLRILVGGDVRNDLRVNKRYSCTLTEGIEAQKLAYERFTNDFRDGGWRRWISLHESQNTLLGAYLFAYNEKVTLIEQKKEAKKLEVQTGGGYSPTRGCSEVLVVYNDGFSENREVEIGSSEFGEFEKKLLKRNPSVTHIECSKEGDIEAPASLVADQISTGVQAEFKNLLAAGEWHEIISAILSRSITKFVRGGFDEEDEE